MPRPPEHPEKHVESPDAAHARFIELQPTLEGLLLLAPLGCDLLEVSKWFGGLKAWSHAMAALLRKAPPPPPPLSERARKIAEALGDQFSYALRLDGIARDTAAAYGEGVRRHPLAAVSVPTKDGRVVVAVAALTAARRAGVDFRPLHQALLEVAAGLSEPTSDVRAYERLLDSAGDRLNRARPFASVLPDPSGTSPAR